MAKRNGVNECPWGHYGEKKWCKKKCCYFLFGDVKAPYPFSVVENLGLVSHFTDFSG
jgi:hypothetical protein